MFGRKKIAIDFGTTNIRILTDSNGVVVNEKNVLVIESSTKQVLMRGNRADALSGRAPRDVEVIRPVKEGVIQNFEWASDMIRHYVNHASGALSVNPIVMICTPSNLTEVNRMVVEKALASVGSREVYLIEEPIAAALGAGMDMNSDRCKLIVDIGGGVTDIAIVVNGSIIVSNSVKVGGDVFDKFIMDYVCKKHKLLISEKTARDLKNAVGCVFYHKEPLVCKVSGRSVPAGIPASAHITSMEIMEALDPPLKFIVGKITEVIERVSAEIKDDLFSSEDFGMILTGGGSLLRGFPEYMHAMINIKTYRPENPELCVVKGMGRVLENLKQFKDDMQRSQ